MKDPPLAVLLEHTVDILSEKPKNFKKIGVSILIVGANFWTCIHYFVVITCFGVEKLGL